MSNSYLDLTQQGQNHWWRFLLSIPLILTFWLGFGSFPILAVFIIEVIRGRIDPLTADPIQGVNALAMYTATLLSFIPLIVGVFLAVRFIHTRRLITLVTPSGRLDWEKFGLGFGLWFLLAGLLSGLEAVLYPGRYQFSFEVLKFLPFFIVSLVLIPIQTSAEEFFFRGYLLQSLGLLMRNPILLSILNGFLFWLPHLGNPEMKVDFGLLSATYFLIGAFLAWITLSSQSLELALGLHAANNLFSSIVASYPAGALPTPAFFSIITLDPIYGLVSTGVGILLFYFVIRGFFPGIFSRRPELVSQLK